MALKKSEKRMLIILAVVVVAAGIFKLIDKPKNVKPVSEIGQNSQIQKSGQTNIPQSQVLPPDTNNSKKNVELKKYDSWGRDPFTIVKPPSPPKKIPPVKIDVVLKGIFWESGKAYVLIDDYVLAEGEEEGGIKVEKIEGKSVICRKGGRQFTLQWRETS
jgi:hypothetical protein